jgi:hypothetical protein
MPCLMFKIKYALPFPRPISLSVSSQPTAKETKEHHLNLQSNHCNLGCNSAIAFIAIQARGKDPQYGFALLPAPALRPRPPESFISTLILRLAMVCPSRAVHAASALDSRVKLTKPKPLLC